MSICQKIAEPAKFQPKLQQFTKMVKIQSAKNSTKNLQILMNAVHKYLSNLFLTDWQRIYIHFDDRTVGKPIFHLVEIQHNTCC